MKKIAAIICALMLGAPFSFSNETTATSESAVSNEIIAERRNAPTGVWVTENNNAFIRVFDTWLKICYVGRDNHEEFDYEVERDPAQNYILKFVRKDGTLDTMMMWSDGRVIDYNGIKYYKK